MGTGTAKLGALLRDAARLDRTQSDPVVALRNAVGVVAPLIIGALAASAAAGLPSTIGALQTAFADRPGPYRLRLVRMLGTALAAAVTAGLAILASSSDLGSVALLLVVGFIAGLLLSGGPAASQVGVAATAAALVLGHLPGDAGTALRVGLLVLAGGAGQALLAVAAWPLGRHRPERVAVAGLYHELAMVARTPAGPGVGPPASAAIDTVRKTLYGMGHDHGPSVEAYRVLSDEAQRIRREILTLAAMIERIAPDDPIAAGLMRAALQAAADVADEIAGALHDGRPVSTALLERARADVHAAGVRLEGATDEHELTRRAAAARLRALAGQLRAAIETTAAGASEGRQPEPPDRGLRVRLRDPVAVLSANLTPESDVLRHAVRLAVLVAGSDLVVRLVGYDRGYWVSLTALVVLRPDFASTFQRSTMRVVGTIIGLLVATELVHWVPGGQWWSIALIGVAFFGMRLAGPGNLLLSAVALSALVVVLLALNGVAPHATLVDRSIATAVGGAIALAATLFLPTWERERLPTRMAALLDAYRAYLEVIANPKASGADRQRARSASRLARSNAQRSVDRARAEPVPATAEIDLGESVLANSHRVVHALMTIDSARVTAPPAELERLLHDAATALTACAAAVRSGRPVRGAPALRPVQEELHALLARDPDAVGGVGIAGAVDDATDRLANAIDTLVAEARRPAEEPAAIASTK